MFIDTHCHLNIIENKPEDALLQERDFPLIAQVIDQAKAAGVEIIINVGTSIPESMNSMAIAKRFEHVYATVGIHPCDCQPERVRNVHEGVAELKKLLVTRHQHKIVAIGEIGLDFYHKPFDVARQKDFFKAQIELALEYALPVVVHVREAGEETLRVLEEYIPNGLRGVIHCFAQNLDFAKTVSAWGFYMGIDAPIGYPKNQALRNVCTAIALDHFILETDAPFLPPQQYRGKRNYPAYIPLIAQMLAEVKSVDVAVIEEATTANAKKLFGV